MLYSFRGDKMENELPKRKPIRWEKHDYSDAVLVIFPISSFLFQKKGSKENLKRKGIVDCFCMKFFGVQNLFSKKGFARFISFWDKFDSGGG